MGTNLRSTIFTGGDPIPFTHTLVQNNNSVLQEQIIRSLKPEVDEINAARPELSSPEKPAAVDPSLSSNNVVSQCLESIKGLVKTSTEGSKHVKRQEAIQRAKHCYEIAFAELVKDSDGRLILKPAKLTTTFTQVLEAHKAQLGLKLFKEGIDNTKAQQQQQRSVLGASSDFNTETLNPAFFNCLKNFHWHKHPLSTCIPTLDQALSILQFLPCAATNRSLLKMIASNNEAYLEYLHEELDKNKGGGGIGDTNGSNEMSVGCSMIQK